MGEPPPEKMQPYPTVTIFNLFTRNTALLFPNVMQTLAFDNKKNCRSTTTQSKHHLIGQWQCELQLSRLLFTSCDKQSLYCWADLPAGGPLGHRQRGSTLKRNMQHSAWRIFFNCNFMLISVWRFSYLDYVCKIKCFLNSFVSLKK